MPIYEYRSEKCGDIQEALQRISDKPLTKCAHCAGKLHKLISHSAFHLKGTGWYVTDYAGKKPSETAKNEAKASSDKPASDASSTAASDKSKSVD